MLSIRMTRVGPRRSPISAWCCRRRGRGSRASRREPGRGQGGRSRRRSASTRSASSTGSSHGAKPSDSVRTLLSKHLKRDLSAVVETPNGAVMSTTDAGGGVSPFRAVLEVVVRALVDRPDAGQGDRDRTAGDDRARVEDGAGRHGQDHRTAGSAGGRLADADRRDGREAREARAAGHQGLGRRGRAG